MSETDLQNRARVRRRAETETAASADPEVARRRLLRLLDDELRRLPVADRSPMACRAGCAFCCHLRVMVTAPEVFGLLDFLRQQFSAAEWAEFEHRLLATEARIRALPEERVLSTNIACPLLRDGECGAYSARPFNCRSYHSLDRAACERSFEQPEDFSLKHPEFIAVAKVNEGAQGGFMAGLRAGGYDARQYELVTALCEALQDPEARARFLRREPAFVRPCPVPS